jgi:hypothetical protein
MTPALVFALMSLATYRLTRLVTRDTILDKPREFFFDHFPPSGERAAVKVDWDEWANRPAGGAFMVPRKEPGKVSTLGQLVECHWCVSVWMTGFVVGAALPLVSLPLPALWFGAVACGAGMLGRFDV